MTSKPTLVFISTRFLFPTDSGGKIRTTQILRGLKGGAFRIRLLMPCSADLRERFASQIDSVCDELVFWEQQEAPKLLKTMRKITWLPRQVPVSVTADWSKEAQQCVEREVNNEPDVVVFDFPHSAILAPAEIRCPSVMFTHNIEAEIFRRHWQVAKSPADRWLWRNQYRKMLQFEKSVLQSFDTTIAVSERDCEFFRTEYGVELCNYIPTGVDTEYFKYKAPECQRRVVFCGSMDWMANIDGIEWFYEKVWPLIRHQVPDAIMVVVGRAPPGSMVARFTSRAPEWSFTGFVDDVRSHLAGADVSVIPLRVGGGTRIKAFEAMAMGTPVVSTSIGIEGLPVKDGVHYLSADTEEEFCRCVVALLGDKTRCLEISESARHLVESKFEFRKAAAVFEGICLQTADQGIR